MNFAEALAAMERGEKVRRDSWSEEEYIYLDNSDAFRCNDEEFASLTRKDLNAPDWEIYNPKPALNPCHCGFSDVCFCEEEVDGKVMFYAQCSECGMRTGYTYDEEWSARIWNEAHPLKENNKTITNCEARLLPFLRDEADAGHVLCRFIRRTVLENEEECRLTPCKECYKRFAAWLQQEYKKEVKDVNR